MAIAGSGWLGFTLSQRQGMAALRVNANHRLDLFAAAVVGMINRLDHVPATIQLNHDVLALFREPRHPQRLQVVTTYLRRLNAHLGSVSVFVLNERGEVLASNDPEQADDGRVGADMSFRTYFLEALSGRVGHHFAAGALQGEPGYYVSHPIRDGARVVGVAAIKISLKPVAEAWAMLGAPALLADSNGVVILSSRADWLYTSLASLTLERRVDLQLTRIYDDRRIGPFPLPVKLSIDADSQVLEGVVPPGPATGTPRSSAGTLVLGRSLDGMDWRLLLFSDLRMVRNQAFLNGLLSAVAASFVLLLMLNVAQRRRIVRQKLEARQLLELANAELEQEVARRTSALNETNERLRTEVGERANAEQTLRAAQDELVQAAKLAVLGQLATGITHELAQPLGAIRTLSGNAQEFQRRGQFDEVLNNLSLIARLVEQMGGIIHPLKVFARKSQATPSATDVAHAVGNALFLFDWRVRHEGVQLHNLCVPGQAIAWCDPNRLEQVLINLIGNALDAMRDSATKVLTVQAELEGDTEPGHAARVRIDVLDTGIGLSADARQHLFEPFFTTKPRGAGLGLGLAISRDIVREFKGELRFHERPGGGACFSVELPAAAQNLPLANTAEEP